MSGTTTKTTKQLTFFLDADKKLHKLCTKKHKTGICGRFHEIPATTQKILWSGTVSADLVGEFKEALREYKRKFAKASRRWLKTKLATQAMNAAPAFAEAKRKILEKHEAEMPIFNFTYTERPMES